MVHDCLSCNFKHGTVVFLDAFPSFVRIPRGPESVELEKIMFRHDPNLCIVNSDPKPFAITQR